MSIVHNFESPKADGPDDTLVRPSDWNANHVFTGVQKHVLTTVGTTGYTIYHNLNSTYSTLIGWSVTWPTWVWVDRIGLTNMDLSFSVPSVTYSDILTTNIEVIA